MRHFSLRYLLLLAALAVVAGAATAPGTAVGQTCGGANLCHCGDEVVESRTLAPGVDPITFTTCLGPGLLITEDNVILDLGGATIRGSGVAAGIEIRDAVGGTAVEGTKVQNGRVVSFRRGIRATFVTGTTISDIQALENTGAGITIEEDGGSNDHNVIDSCIVRNNGGDGVLVVGDNSTVTLCRIESNGGTGLTVDGTNNDILRNIVYRSGGGGIHITGAIAGPGSTADRNQAKYNGAQGFLVEGQHTLTLNISNSNDTDGFTVTASDSLFERNTASYNGRPGGGQPADGYGIRDTTGPGNGTAGTDNTYVSNRCTGNGLGASSPAGLCK